MTRILSSSAGRRVAPSSHSSRLYINSSLIPPLRHIIRNTLNYSSLSVNTIQNPIYGKGLDTASTNISKIPRVYTHVVHQNTYTTHNIFIIRGEAACTLLALLPPIPLFKLKMKDYNVTKNMKTVMFHSSLNIYTIETSIHGKHINSQLDYNSLSVYSIQNRIYGKDLDSK